MVRASAAAPVRMDVPTDVDMVDAMELDLRHVHVDQLAVVQGHDPDVVLLLQHHKHPLNFYSSRLHLQHQHQHQHQDQHEHGYWDFLNHVDLHSSPTARPPRPRPCVRSFRPPRINTTMPDVDIHSSSPSSSAAATAAVDITPSSPPDLTGSKSSKSSGSFRSSCLTDAQDHDNLSHFEDIALADSGRNSADDLHIQHHHHNHHHHERKPPAARPAQRRVVSAAHVSAAKRTGAPPPDVLRDATNMTRPRYPSLKGHVNAASDNARPMRRGFTSPSVPSLAMGARPRPSSRSPSPTGHALSDGGRSPRSAASNFSKGFGPRPPLKPRKTVQELEAEYHDSDEEVPEDAVIWNVPISARNPTASTPPSPIARSASQTNLTPNPPLTPAKRGSAPEHPRRSLQRPSIPHSATVSAFPVDALAPGDVRRKSWTEDLSDEAREVAAALEEHAEQQSAERRRSVRNSNGNSPPRPSMKLRTKTSIMELPPVQKGNVMIDPLPVSREKEAVLTRTRPSWLPPKCQKEEKKHMKQWEQMMVAAEQAAKKRAAKEAEEHHRREQMQGSIARIWEEHVLPNWEAVVREPRTRELWWRGVTPRDRGTVWSKAVGNELSLTETSYTSALKRARTLRSSVSNLSDEERARHADAAWIAAVSRDVPTVFPELGIFGVGAPLHDTLEDVLLAYSAYRSDVGYVYGIHLIAGLLVLNMSASNAFITLANLLNRPMGLAFLVSDQTSMHKIYDTILATMKYKLPHLHDHLMDPKTGFDDGPEEWLYPFLSTLGTQHLGPDMCSRLWDVAVFEGDKTFVRAIVGVMSLLESKLYGDREDILRLIGWRTKQLDFDTEEEVMGAIREAGKISASSTPDLNR